MDQSKTPIPPKINPADKRQKRFAGPRSKAEPAQPGHPGAENKQPAENKRHRAPKGPLPPPVDNPALPAFELVPQMPRHDGWTAERQRAFIAALADTGCVTRACRYVNMAPGSAYRLRRQPGADSFRRAWVAALDLGVQRLKDELYERALEGQLHPVFVGGKLKGFKRVKNDRLLMFALRMNATDEYGRRLAATYFDPAASRLHGGSGVSDGGERAKPSSSSGPQGAERLPAGHQLLGPSPLAGEGLGRGGVPALSMEGPNPLPTRITETVTGPAVTQRQKDAHNAALVAHFDPVAMTLPEIEAMQAALVEEAARKRAEEDGPPEHATGINFIALREEDDFKAAGPLEDIEPVVTEEDREPEFDEEEVRWWDLGDADGD